MKKTQVVTGKDLVERASWEFDDYYGWIHLNSVSDYGFWVLTWPKHCQTTHHLSDCYIEGPFETEEEAEKYAFSV